MPDKVITTDGPCGCCAAAPVITTQPQPACVVPDDPAVFSIEATGGSLTYQWQIQVGLSWVDLMESSPYSGVTTDTLTINPADIGLNGSFYRCVVTNDFGTAESDSAMLTVGEECACCALTIEMQPSPQSVEEGSGATFSVVLDDDTDVVYQWQVSVGGGAWTDITTGPDPHYSGADTDTLSITAAPLSFNGNAYRCKFTKTGCDPECDDVFSDGAELEVTPCVEVDPGDENTGSPTSVDVSHTFPASGGRAAIILTGTVSMEIGPFTFGPGGSGGGAAGGKDTMLKATALTATYSGPGTTPTITGLTVSGLLTVVNGGTDDENLGQCPTGPSGPPFAISVTVNGPGVGASFGSIYGQCMIDGGHYCP